MSLSWYKQNRFIWTKDVVVPQLVRAIFSNILHKTELINFNNETTIRQQKDSQSLRYALSNFKMTELNTENKLELLQSFC